MRTEEKIEGIRERRMLQKQLYRMGVNRSYQGFILAVDAALMLRNDESLKTCMKIIYLDVAAKNHTSRGNVERDIRTLIQAIWRRGDKEALEELAGRSLDRPPTCQEFIGFLANYMKKKEERG